ncbi:diguanylate cyclase [Tardiphaga sp. 20_F10_N6_6]|jgi:diguanylate cyclase (GGDEF)-like protein|uniref:GGDEF domain-containing protein n=1 Tax=unclassified Tardiphaga TaxID=2631404 RepID=UPI0008A814A5|nr:MULTISPECIES: GGDEF domain-containing protein [unclassified Tardiphaga]SEI24506.1 diguanylate cyclase (GGDEF) domain-containing protein [Tardiphaga sp. OK245]SNT64439.1 diguanylate cyclase (GGDEF) domain-containing protein [Tardiphaga sp. OK246]
MTSITTLSEGTDASTRDLRKDSALRIARRRTAYIAQASSYLIDAAILLLYAMIGVTTVATGVVYLAIRLAVVGIAAYLSEIQVNDRFKDPYLTVPLSIVSIIVQIGAIYLVPQIGFYFISIIFVVLGFAALRMSARQTGIVWSTATLGLALLFLMTDKPIGIPMATATERALALACFVSALGRCASAGLYGSSMRELLYRRSNDLAAANVRIEELAQLDELTGALNRRYIMKCLNDEIAKAQRNATTCCIAIIDLDHFKKINDHFGHPVGDEVLRAFAISVFANIRTIDRFGRQGGEEFLLILPDTDIDLAIQTLDRLRGLITELNWSAIAQDLTLTISAGISAIRPNDTPEDILARADLALYRAKDTGRDRVVAAPQKRQFS